MKRVRVDNELENVQSPADKMDQKDDNTTITEDFIREDKEQRFLYHAALKGDYENLAKFFKSGEYDEINLKPVDHQQYRSFSITPLHIAVKKGHIECVQMFIDNKMNVNSQDHKSFTPLHIAAEKGKLQCLKLLLEAGADTSATTNIHSARPGETALHVAVWFNQVECVKELIRCGADCSATDIFGNTSLHLAAKLGFSQCVLAHLSGIRDKTLLSLQIPKSLDTVLHMAIRSKMFDCVEELVRLGANVNITNCEKMSPLHELLSSENIDSDTKKKLLKFIIFEGDNTDMSNVLLPNLYNKCDIKLKKFLIAYGAKIDFVRIGSSETYFEYELFSYDFPNFLECILNVIPRLPFLQTFKDPQPIHVLRLDLLTERYNCLPSADEIWLDSVLPNDVKFALVLRKGDLYAKMVKISDDFTVDTSSTGRIVFSHLPGFEICNPSPTCSKSPSEFHFVKFIPLVQPYLDLVYKRVSEQLEDFKDIYTTSNSFNTKMGAEKLRLLKLQQHLWYHKIASNPRTLKHHCRFAIRKELGPLRLKFIRNLPLPQALQAYLLFECNEGSN